MALVDAKLYIPDAIYEMRYGTDNNVLGRVLHPDYPTLIQEVVAVSLAEIQAEIEKDDRTLVFWDLWRPEHVHKALMDFNPDPMSVNPSSPHLWGGAVDGTLAQKSTGQFLDMGTDFDDFTVKAWPDFEGLQLEQREHRDYHTDVFARHGFVDWQTEWFHKTFEALISKPESADL